MPALWVMKQSIKSAATPRTQYTRSIACWMLTMLSSKAMRPSTPGPSVLARTLARSSSEVRSTCQPPCLALADFRVSHQLVRDGEKSVTLEEAYQHLMRGLKGHMSGVETSQPMVLAVPSRLTLSQRALLKNSAAGAGLNVVLISQALAMAAGYAYKQASIAAAPAKHKALLCNMGSGQMEVAVVEIGGGEVHVLASDWCYVGGEDVDAAMVHHFVQVWCPLSLPRQSILTWSVTLPCALERCLRRQSSGTHHHILCAWLPQACLSVDEAMPAPHHMLPGVSRMVSDGNHPL
jgi:hypothetical protein